jgi:hypothetical protein
MEGTPMTRRTAELFVTLMFALLVGLLAVDAQPPGKTYRLGVLATTSWPPFDAFREGLRGIHPSLRAGRRGPHKASQQEGETAAFRETTHGT